METALIEAVVFQLSLVFAPALAFAGFGGIRWDLRARGTWSARIVRTLTLAMWGLVMLNAVGTVLNVRALALAVLAICLAAFLLRPRIGALLGHPPDPRRRAAEAVRNVFEHASSRFKPVDADELREELAALDEHVTPETFEFIQLTRAHVLHWLDGGSDAEPNAKRWRDRIMAIGTEWWPPASTTARRDPRRITRAVITRWRLPLTVIGGAVLGAWTWAGGWPSPLEVTAGIVIAYLFMWTDQLLVGAAGLVGAVVGLAASTGLQVVECPSCDWASTVATVALISLVGLFSAGYLVISSRRRRASPALTVIGGPPDRDEVELPRP